MNYRTSTNSLRTAPFIKVTVTITEWVQDLRYNPERPLLIAPQIGPCRSMFVVGQTETTIELLLLLSGYRFVLPGLDDGMSVDRYLQEIGIDPSTIPHTQRDLLSWSEAMTLLDQARDFIDSEKHLKDLLNLLNDRRYEPLHLYEYDPPYNIPFSVFEAIWDPVFGVIQIHANGSDQNTLNRLISRILHSYNDCFSHGSTAHYRLTINDFTSLRKLNDTLSDEFIKNVKHHLLIIDYDVNLSSSFRSTFEQTQLVPFLKSILQHEKVLLINRNRYRFESDDLPITTFQFYSGIAEDPRWT